MVSKVSNSISELFSKKDKIVPPPIPTAGYYLAVNGKKKGPYDLSKFKKMMKDDTFNSESLIWKEGWEARCKVGFMCCGGYMSGSRRRF